MAGLIVTPTSIISGGEPTKGTGGTVWSSTPLLDQEANVLPYSGYRAGEKGISPIARLAAVADLNKPIPTAGQYAIDHSKEPQLKIPSECYLYDEDRPWVLGKLNREALDIPEPAEPVSLSKSVLDRLDFLEIAAIQANKRAQQISYQGEASAPKMVTYVSEEKNANVTVEEKIEPVVSKEATKSRNASPSPAAAKGTPRPVSKGRPSTSPGPKSGAAGDRPKTLKSPGRGVSPQTKIVSSGAPKKVMNAKVDLEIVEKKN